jgi:hypothetical protein
MEWSLAMMTGKKTDKNDTSNYWSNCNRPGKGQSIPAQLTDITTL